MWILSWQIHHGSDLCPSASFEIMEICQRVSCFVDVEKAYDHVLRDKLWAVMLEYDVRDQLLAAIKSLYKQSKSVFASIA